MNIEKIIKELVIITGGCSSKSIKEELDKIKLTPILVKEFYLVTKRFPTETESYFIIGYGFDVWKDAYNIYKNSLNAMKKHL